MVRAIDFINDASDPASLAEHVFARLRADIVNGKFAADAKLGMKDLCARYEVGLSPIREALNRLAGEGFVKAAGQRGFTVPTLDLVDLEDLVELRALVEEAAIRQALVRGDDAWEARIVAAFHMLGRNVQRIAKPTDEVVRQYDAVHREFHVALYGGVISPRLAKLHGDLFDQASRYRKTIHLLPVSPQEILAEHQRVMEAVLSRDSDNAVSVLRRHLSLTVAATREYLMNPKT